MKQSGMSKNLLERVPLYLQYLRSGAEVGATVSATAIARALRLGEVQVRKDLGAVSGAGKPRVGYVTSDLIRHLERYLDGRTENDAVIVGAGKLGRALLDYEGFGEYGLRVCAAFDADEAKTGESAGGKPVLPLSAFPDYCEHVRPRIGIITVPEDAAAGVCEMMVRCGIRGIWNFSRCRLRPPAPVLVRNENLAAALAVLSGDLNSEGE